jgi:hypothetical protein
VKDTRPSQFRSLKFEAEKGIKGSLNGFVLLKNNVNAILTQKIVQVKRIFSYLVFARVFTITDGQSLTDEISEYRICDMFSALTPLLSVRLRVHLGSQDRQKKQAGYGILMMKSSYLTSIV